MNKWLLAGSIVLISASGCISISTYEQRMKQCREAAAQSDQLKAQVASLDAKNQSLTKELAEQTSEKEHLTTEISDVRKTYDELVQELKDNIAEGDVGVKETDEGLTITLGNKILFKSGSEELQASGKKVLSRVAKILKKVTGKLIQVEGHTDNVRISGSLKNQFHSNWDLSAARSASVVRYLQETGKIDPSLIVLTAFAEYRPLEDNGTPHGRQQNRRVDIVLIPNPHNAPGALAK